MPEYTAILKNGKKRKFELTLIEPTVLDAERTIDKEYKDHILISLERVDYSNPRGKHGKDTR